MHADLIKTSSTMYRPTPPSGNIEPVSNISNQLFHMFLIFLPFLIFIGLVIWAVHMKKKSKQNERKELSSKDFTKKFIKNLIINGLIVGIVLYIVYGIAKEFLPSIAILILNFVLIFVGIVKIYLSSIKDTFYEGKIQQTDINKIARNIVLIFVVLFLINVALNYLSYLCSLEYAKLLGLQDIALRNLIINIVVNIVMYTIITIICRIKFLKECENTENIV